MSFWKALFRILRPRIADKSANPYDGLRRQILNATPQTLGAADAPPGKVLGLLMETGYEKAVVTLVVLVDDTVSLYFSNGGGMIGLGAHEGPRDAGRRLLAKAPGFVTSFHPVVAPATPAIGLTQFVALSPEGTRWASARETDLGNNLHALSPLFHAAHEVITQIRLQSER